jgi:hypothetical protein
MDFAESRIVKQELQRSGLDADTALAVLLKTLADDHLARLPDLELRGHRGRPALPPPEEMPQAA